MTNTWKPIRKCAVALYQFSPTAQEQIPLEFGELIETSEEIAGWIRGRSLMTERIGIFPSNHVKIISDDIPSKKILMNSVFHPYIEADPIEVKISLKKKIITIISQGNELTGVNEQPRNSKGHLATEDNTKINKLFKLYKQMSQEEITKKEIQKLEEDCQLLLRLDAFVIDIDDDIEFNFSLYDFSKKAKITSDYSIFLRKGEQPMDLVSKNILKTLFVEITKSDRENLYISCDIVRYSEIANQTKKTKKIQNKSDGQLFRRPYACCVLALSNDLLQTCSGKLMDFVADVFTPNQESFFRNIQELIISNDPKVEKKVGSRIAIQLSAHFGKLNEVLKKHTALLSIQQTLKMKLPQVVLPSYYQHDLYIAMKLGDFSNCKAKNIEYRLTVRKNNGNELRGCINLQGKNESNEKTYRGLVLYHRIEPHWNENIKISIDPLVFPNTHLYFEFYSCSADSKKKIIKPIGFTYLYLKKKGAVLNQGDYTLPIYKYQTQNSEPLLYLKEKSQTQPEYLIITKDKIEINFNLCSTIMTQEPVFNKFFNWEGSMNQSDTRNLLETITYIDQTQFLIFTGPILDTFFRILGTKGDEIVHEIFMTFNFVVGVLVDLTYQNFKPILQDYLDTKFNFKNQKTNQELKICFSKIYPFLINELIHQLREAENEKSGSETRKTIRALEFIFKFIINSKLLELDLIENDIIKKPENYESLHNDFIKQIEEVLQSINELMEKMEPDWIIGTQTIAITKLYPIYEELIKILPIQKIGLIVSSLFKSVAYGRKQLDDEKIKILLDISTGPLVSTSDFRKIFFPIIFKQLIRVISTDQETFEKGIKIIRKMIKSVKRSISQMKRNLGNESIIQSRNVSIENVILGNNQEQNQQTEQEYKKTGKFRMSIPKQTKEPSVLELTKITSLIVSVFRINQKKTEKLKLQAKPDRANLEIIEKEIHSREQYECKLIIMLLSILHMMKPLEAQTFVAFFHPNPTQQASSLIDLLKVFNRIFKFKTFPKEWRSMSFIQFSIIFKQLRFFLSILRRNFYSPKFEVRAWEAYLKTLVSFMKIPHLQFELYSNEANRKILLERFGDMRIECSELLKNAWILIGNNQHELISTTIKPFLSLVLLENPELQLTGLDLYYSLVETEFTKTGKFNYVEQHTMSVIDLALERGMYKKFEQKFFPQIYTWLMDHQLLKEKGVMLASQLKEVVEHIFLVRKYSKKETFTHELSEAIIDLIDYLRRKKSYDMVTKYISMLYNLNIRRKWYPEAANTLLLYSDLLKWDYSKQEMPLFNLMRESQAIRKENIIKKAIDCFDQGNWFEKGIELVNLLKERYLKVSYNYQKFCGMLKKELEMYERIMRIERMYSTYFRVGFYGKGFEHQEKFLNVKNCEFIYKGQLLERLAGFVEYLQERYPKAQISPKEPPDQFLEGDGQYIQVATVIPSFQEELEGKKRIFDENIPDFAKNFIINDSINVFLSSKPIQKIKDKENEFRYLWLHNEFLITEDSFPSIRNRLKVIKKVVHELSPIQNAINTTENKNIELSSYIKLYKSPSGKETNLNQLSMCLNGIIDAAVNGGVFKYQQAFFTEEYLKENPNDEDSVIRLKLEFLKQQDLLEEGLKLHRQLGSEETRRFHDKLTKFFGKMRRLLEPSLIDLRLEKTGFMK
ncbi:dedicator of cytokinesis [Anaeramoeba ignava]|uniref:Dedicator of cytokinesis n=1 Tax=Anaeramoeba ignava TaxID=1746090 RepID=A0A9Q0LIK1_ANAIG|nr:dedicator of cytokinesis [Anaeramoeba ignava]